MKLATVVAIVERDRALEGLRSRHPALLQAAALYAGASTSFYPWAPTVSLVAFEHWMLSELRSLGPAQVERKLLAVLFGLMKATAFEHLLAITRARDAYAAAWPGLPAQEPSRLRYPTLAVIDKALVKTAISFEHADAALQRPSLPSDSLWASFEGLERRVLHLRQLRNRMESALRSVERHARRRRYSLAETLLSGLAATAAAIAAITWAQQLLVR